jgi:TPR repeat protein
MRGRTMKQWVTTLLAGGLLALTLFGVAIAGESEDGLAGVVVAYKRGDYATALRLVRPLAERGNATAQRLLGLMYALGNGLREDDKLAILWYRKAADQGNREAQLAIGYAYSLGQGEPHDDALSATWFRKAADQGNGEAQEDIGILYLIGKGVPQDFALAYMWFILAAVHGATAEIREDAVKHRDEAAPIMTLDQIAEAQRMAREWKPK